VTDTEYATTAQNANVLWLGCAVVCAYRFGYRKEDMLNLCVHNLDLLGRWIEWGNAQRELANRARCG
jgi:hypothetical protein